MLIFMICATRTNLVYTLIFLSLLLVFLLLSSAYWQLGQGNAAIGDRCVKVSIIPCFSNSADSWFQFWLDLSLFQGAGASLFVASLLGFYLLIVQLFEAMGFPFHLPVGDLAVLWTCKRDKWVPQERLNPSFWQHKKGCAIRCRRGCYRWPQLNNLVLHIERRRIPPRDILS